MAVANGDVRHRHAHGNAPSLVNGATIAGKNDIAHTNDDEAKSSSNLLNLIICVGGIYVSFITWGVLQERITTTNYGTSRDPEVFKFSVVVNTIQSTFAALLGYIYVLATRKSSSDLPIFPSRHIIFPLTLVAITSSLGSPFGYASLAHVDYITFILGKSCKLLPVMFLHVTLYGRRYPWYKYVVVLLVTIGVAVFTLHQPASSKKKGPERSSIYGLVLLSINLLFDGLTNTTQDSIHSRFRGYTGQQMMCSLNLMSTLLTSSYLLLSPYIAHTGVGAFFGMDLWKYAGELEGAIAFIQRHPAVLRDILAFAACGALGQVFIFMTLSIFGSLLLVTVTVTRKMLTMIVSVVWFGHRLTGMQWLGVGLVFGGIGLEAQLSKMEKQKKKKAN
ncbi:UDP-galactose transporter 1 [Lecanosticta acicola]|uniref:UDP-galactose transporter homolog 1 n=1 Tax=Lecanosticta acicola TaxID=111012 RepID=A0AAI9EBH3_9PEZI|nr:UDP-galactose transporter 1 [Lecanosticta acicola]